MNDPDAGRQSWWAKGLLVENCNCQVVCPGHVHFSQDCTYERCRGFWAVLVDAAADDAQRGAVETILAGRAGGPWEVLDRFVGHRLPTRSVAIAIEDEGRRMRVTADGLLDATVEDIRGRDRDRPVLFHNMFNQIHAPTQVIARGRTRYDDGEIVVDNEGTHGLHSRFDWAVESK
jgi:hypothetical protein